LAHDKMMRAIDLIGTKVAPRVRERVGRDGSERLIRPDTQQIKP